MTRIALPISSYEGASSAVFEHFGRSGSFIVIEADGCRIISTRLLENTRAQEGEEKSPAALIFEEGVDVVLAGSIGPCMSTPILDMGIRIYCGASGTVQDALGKYGAGELKEVSKSRYSL